jgi:hypothetical protein
MTFGRLAHQPPWTEFPSDKPPISFRSILRGLRRVAISLSALLCVYFAYCWSGSEGVSSLYKNQPLGITILSEDGRCEITRIYPFHMLLGPFVISATERNAPPGRASLGFIRANISEKRFGGFVYGTGWTYDASAHDVALYSQYLQRANVHIIGFPYWFAVLLTGLWPAIALIHLTRRKVRLRAQTQADMRIACGLCPRCLYDMRATPERCPECGWQRDAESTEKAARLGRDAGGRPT